MAVVVRQLDDGLAFASQYLGAQRRLDNPDAPVAIESGAQSDHELDVTTSRGGDVHHWRLCRGDSPMTPLGGDGPGVVGHSGEKPTVLQEIERGRRVMATGDVQSPRREPVSSAAGAAG